MQKGLTYALRVIWDEYGRILECWLGAFGSKLENNLKEFANYMGFGFMQTLIIWWRMS